MDKTKPFGLVIPKRAKTFCRKSNSVFNSDSDDEPSKKKACTKIPQAKPLSKLTIKAEECNDPSIYEYDSIYDDMKAQEKEKLPQKDNKPSRYIDSLLKAADKRKKQHERRVEKKVQAEREKEGDKFKDKEAFVTSAYKKKMLEMEEQEERERRENMLNDMMDVTKQNDLSGFYRHFLKQAVGEEKVPVFGEKMEIKKEPQGESDTEQTGQSVTDCLEKDNKLEENIDRDSDIVSSSEEETPCLNSGIVISEKRNTDISHSSKMSSDLFNDDKLEDTDNASSYKRVEKKQFSRNIRKRNESSSEFSSEPDSPNKEKENPGVVQTNGNTPDIKLSVTDDGPSNEKPEKMKEKRDIFKKRTVGSVFAEAQARYFQRMAARG